MTPHIHLTRRARNLPLSALNRPRRPSRWITAARIAAAVLVLAWLASLAAMAWVLIP
jgi:hypothetical protein